MNERYQINNVHTIQVVPPLTTPQDIAQIIDWDRVLARAQADTLVRLANSAPALAEQVERLKAALKALVERCPQLSFPDDSASARGTAKALLAELGD